MFSTYVSKVPISPSQDSWMAVRVMCSTVLNLVTTLGTSSYLGLDSSGRFRQLNTHDTLHETLRGWERNFNQLLLPLSLALS